jgi:hypothetical protein
MFSKQFPDKSDSFTGEINQIKNNIDGAGRVDQEVELLSSKYEALSSNLSATKTKQKE